MTMTPRAESEVRRLVTRFAIERIAAGWSTWDLGRASRVYRSNIDRAESGETIPTLPVLIDMAEPLGLRLDWVPAHLQPLLALDEFETRALIAAAVKGWQHMTWGPSPESALVKALTKLGQFKEEEAGAEDT